MNRISAASLFLLALCCSLSASCDAALQASPGEPDALAWVRAAHPGAGRLDREIRRLQRLVGEAPDPIPHLDRLGWAFVEKARGSGDPGFYHLAERCGVAMAELGRDGPEAWLLRGHALHALHRFDAAEALARRLVEARGRSFDHGLLGDVLLDRGDLDGAVVAYQRMADLRPDSHALVRAARVRFLVGDAEGALRASTAAARATSPRNAEHFAWTWSQLAGRLLEAGDLDGALRATATALAAQPDSAPALLTRGRVLMAQGRVEGALEPLRRAAARSPMPQTLWALAEALHASHRPQEEAAVRARLLESGATTDPRGFALYLASHDTQAARALELAERELAARPDLYSHAALAWALLANRRVDEARQQMDRALARGTRDARLFLQAGVIAEAAGELDEAAGWFARAEPLRHTLLPSQQALLDARLTPPRVTDVPS